MPVAVVCFSCADPATKSTEAGSFIPAFILYKLAKLAFRTSISTSFVPQRSMTFTAPPIGNINIAGVVA